MSENAGWKYKSLIAELSKVKQPLCLLRLKFEIKRIKNKKGPQALVLLHVINQAAALPPSLAQGVCFSDLSLPVPPIIFDTLVTGMRFILFSPSFEHFESDSELLQFKKAVNTC